MSELKENKQRSIEVTGGPNSARAALPMRTCCCERPPARLSAIEKTGEALCPYCGTQYKLKAALRIASLSQPCAWMKSVPHFIRAYPSDLEKNPHHRPLLVGDTVMAPALVHAAEESYPISPSSTLRSALGRPATAAHAGGNDSSSIPRPWPSALARPLARARQLRHAATTKPLCCRIRSNRRCCPSSPASLVAPAIVGEMRYGLLNDTHSLDELATR